METVVGGKRPAAAKPGAVGMTEKQRGETEGSLMPDHSAPKKEQTRSKRRGNKET
jgi:hypothetical protein